MTIFDLSLNGTLKVMQHWGVLLIHAHCQLAGGEREPTWKSLQLLMNNTVNHDFTGARAFKSLTRMFK